MAGEPRRCRAVADYVAKADDELSFKKDDVIFVPKPNSGERWQGVFNGKVGWFPKVYVDDKTVEVKAGTTTRVQAVRDYEAQDEGELSFPKDAIMFVVARESEKYWKGVYQGNPGLIPALHVQDATERKIDAPIKTAKCIAVKTHYSTNPKHLSFKLGETVFVANPDDTLDEWKGVCFGEMGSFPKQHVQDVEKGEEEIKIQVEQSKQNSDEMELMKQVDDLRQARKEKLETDVKSPSKEPPNPPEQNNPLPLDVASPPPTVDAKEQQSVPEVTTEVEQTPSETATKVEITEENTVTSSQATPEPVDPKEAKRLAKLEAKRLKEEEKARKKAEKEAEKQRKAQEKAAKKKS